MKKLNAFTLAEVLITLGVIGVIAAITMPSVVKKYQKISTVTKLKKVYTTLNQAIKLSEAENGEYEYWEQISDIGEDAYFNKYWKPYLKSAKICNTYQACGYKSNSPWVNLQGTNAQTPGVTYVGRLSLILTDGAFVSIQTLSGGKIISTIYVDINAGNLPNKLGRDAFYFTRTNKGQVVASEGNNCTPSGVGTSCAKKIIEDGWQIMDDYPW